MRYLLLDAAAGIGVLATITLSARRAPQKRSRHIRALGWVLVAGPCRSPSLCRCRTPAPDGRPGRPFSRLWLPSRSGLPSSSASTTKRTSVTTRTMIRRRGGRSSSASSAPTRADRRAAADHQSVLTLSRRAE